MSENNVPQLNKLDTQKQIKKAKRRRTIIIILLICLIPFAIWGGIKLVSDVNSYKIRVDGKRDGTLSLSFDRNFLDGGFSVLKGVGVQNTQNSSGTSYSLGISDYVEGVMTGEIAMEIDRGGQSAKATANGGDEFIASKFYLRNNNREGADDIQYVMRINIHENVKNALSAARFYVISDIDTDDLTREVFAQPSDDGSSEYVSTKYRGSSDYVLKPGTDEEWLCTNLVYGEEGWYYESEPITLSSGEIRGYTIGVWYEGSDPNHNNAIIGGYITFEVTFSVI